MSSPSRASVLGLVALVAMVALVACGGSEPGGALVEPSASTAVTPPPPPPSAPPSAPPPSDASVPPSPFGVRADYFDGFHDLVLTRTEPAVALRLADGVAPHDKVRAVLYSVRYTAALEIAAEGVYELVARSDDGVRVFVDGKLAVDDFTIHALTETRAKVTLTRGAHALRVDYFQHRGAAELELLWTPPGGRTEPIPPAALKPAAAAPTDAAGVKLPGPVPTFTNPVVPFDCPDPGVLRDGGARPTYYMVCTGGTMAIRSSDDLVSWTATGKSILPSGKASWSANGARNWAPEIHKVGASYVAYYTAADGADRLAIGAASAPSPLGPWVDRGGPLVTDAMGAIDATFFQDDDGKRYLYWKVDGNATGRPTPILVRELAATGLDFAPGSTATTVLTNDASTFEGGVVEAPWVVKRSGLYYMFYSANVYDDRYRTGVARASSPRGPFTKRGAPLLGNNARWVGPGHGSVVTTHGVDLFFHHAWPALPNGKHDTSKGRHGLIAPITWRAGWPELGTGTSVTGPIPWP